MTFRFRCWCLMGVDREGRAKNEKPKGWKEDITKKKEKKKELPPS